MKRLVIITVGKTHSGKTTFAKQLEKELDRSFVVDQDNHATFIHTYYQKLLPTSGTNTLKTSLTKFIVNYAKEYTDLHIIVSNSNLSRKGRTYLLEEIYPKEEFVRILVYFDIPDEILYERVRNSKRSTNILRTANSFEEVLMRQQEASQLADVKEPTEGEADVLFVLKNAEEAEAVMKKIIDISKRL